MTFILDTHSSRTLLSPSDTAHESVTIIYHMQRHSDLNYAMHKGQHQVNICPLYFIRVFVKLILFVEWTLMHIVEKHKYTTSGKHVRVKYTPSNPTFI